MGEKRGGGGEGSHANGNLISHDYGNSVHIVTSYRKDVAFIGQCNEQEADVYEDRHSVKKSSVTRFKQNHVTLQYKMIKIKKNYFTVFCLILLQLDILLCK